MLLTGTFRRALDDKLRVAIPKSLRDIMGHPQRPLAYLAPGTDGSLVLYTEEAFLRLAQLLSASSPTGEDVRAFSRLFYAQAQPVEIDRQGRIRVPPDLAKLAGLEKDIVLLGVRDHLELWDRNQWETYRGEKQLSYDEIAERAFPQPVSIASAQEGDKMTVPIGDGATPARPR